MITTADEAEAIQTELRGLLKERPGLFTAKGRRLRWLADEFAAWCKDQPAADPLTKGQARLLLRELRRVVKAERAAS